MHESVLLKEVVENLAVKNSETVVDMTLGQGGHVKAIIESGVKNLKIIGLDADPIAIEKTKEVLSPYQSQHRFIFENIYFDQLDKVLSENKISAVDKILFDLGFRSDQVDDPSRGFSFLKEGPLDMSFCGSNFGSNSSLNQHNDEILTAFEIVNEWQEDSLSDIIYGFGEERFARRIARKIVEAREQKKEISQKDGSCSGKIETTTELAEIIKSAVPFFYRHRKTHPATKTFQALRIAVNSELERLKTALNICFDKLNPNGRIAIISFHSLEDRIVKRFFRQKNDIGLARLLNKKPIIPTKEEINKNPRSRSAKLRIIEKTS